GDHPDLVEGDRSGSNLFARVQCERQLAARPPDGQDERESSEPPPLEELHGMPSGVERNETLESFPRHSHPNRNPPLSPGNGFCKIDGRAMRADRRGGVSGSAESSRCWS